MQKRKNEQKMNFRSAAVLAGGDGAPATLDEASRSVMVTAATETPVDVFDYERFEIVPEVLLMSGIEMPKSRQVVLLDSHSRFDSSSVIGSLRGMTVNGGELRGRVVFSTEAESVFRKVAEGHLTDFSIGYRVVQSQWIPDGEKATIKGRSFEGPVKVATRWRVKELSAVPIGADEMAKARGENSENQIIVKEQSSEMSEEQVNAIRQQEQDRIVEIDGMCKTFDVPDDIRANLIRSGKSADEARKDVMAHVKRNMESGIGYRPPYDGHPAHIVHDAVDKRIDAQVDGLCLRAGLPVEKPSGGANEYRNFSFLDHAKECLRAAGRRVNGGPDQIIRESLESRALTTGDLPTILGGFANKSALIGFNEGQSPIVSICHEGSAQNFKDQYLAKLSESDDLEEVPEKGDFQYGSRAEHAESYQLATYGKIFAITRQALINDDLGLLSQIPRSHGAAAARKVRDVICAVLSGNAAMSDGTALFHADHSNFVGSGSGGAPAAETLETAYIAMKEQTGPNGAVLGIQPRYLVVPVALEVDSWQLLESTGDLSDNKSSGVKNPWYQRLELIPEPALDASSAVGWYLATDQRRCDTIVLAYLNGNSAPYLESKIGWTTDGIEYKVRLDVAAKAADWRGLFFNYGS